MDHYYFYYSFVFIQKVLAYHKQKHSPRPISTMGCTNSKPAEEMPPPAFLTLEEAKQIEASLAKAKEERLKTMDVFVLDNSLRETAVASIKGQVSSDKDKILQSLQNTGLTDIIVAAFGPLRRPEDVWLEKKSKSNEINKESWWAFSEIADNPNENDVFLTPIPSGVLRCKQYGINNIIMEVDVICKRWDGYTIDQFNELFQTRVEFIRQFSPNAKILINIRDAPSAFFHEPCKENYPERMATMVTAISKLEHKIFGIVFEVSALESFLKTLINF
jgi:hypothetical protein